MPAKILVIEDNRENLDLMIYLVRAFRHVALAAAHGAEGLKVAAAEKPDLIVCDMQMPRMDGFEVLTRLRAVPETAGIPVVAVTAMALPNDRERIARAGFTAQITKPIDPETFVQQLESILTHAPAGSAAASDDPNAASPPASPGRGTILVVDDQRVNLELNQSLFEPLGYTVLTSSNVREGIELARRKPPDLILADVHHPDGDGGVDMVRACKQDPVLSKIPFILITSTYCNEAARNQGLALGARRFIFRPIDPEVLVAEVESCLRET